MSLAAKPLPYHTFQLISSELQEVENHLRSLFPPSQLDSSAYQLITAGGKRLRPALVLLSAKLGEINDKVIKLAMAVEILHMATLVHDDILDHSDLRRGQPTAHVRFGINKALLLGDYFYAKFLSLIADCEPIALKALSTVVSDLVKAEFHQRSHLFNCNISEGQYLYRIGCKAGSYLANCCRLGALQSGAEPKLVSALKTYGYCLGVAFQLQDDWLDYAGNKAYLGKPISQDLSSGILTLPVIHCLQNSKFRQELMAMISEGMNNPSHYQLLQEELTHCGSLEYTALRAKKYALQARAVLQILPKSPIKETLQKLARYTVERRV